MAPSRFADPVHSARLYVGLDVNNEVTGKRIRRLSAAEVARLVRTAVDRGSGGITIIPADGRYIDERTGKVKYVPEKARVFDLSVSMSVSCPVFKRRIWRVAAEIARLGKQSSVLAVTECSTSKRDATYINAKGRRHQPLPRLRPDRGLNRRRR